MEPLKKAQVEGFLMFAEPEVLFGNLDELCSVRPLKMLFHSGWKSPKITHFEKFCFCLYKSLIVKETFQNWDIFSDFYQLCNSSVGQWLILKLFFVILGHPLLLQRVPSGSLDPFRRWWWPQCHRFTSKVIRKPWFESPHPVAGISSLRA